MNSERQTAKPQQHQPTPVGGLLQRAAVTPAAPELAPPIVYDVLRTPGQPLDASTRAFMEPRFGRDFGNVRVHTDAQAAESARAVNALAYTVGRNVVFGVGQHQPQSEQGKRLIAHELTHVVQQRGSATNSLQLAGGASCEGAEVEASHISNQVVQTAHLAPISPVLASAPLAIYRAAAVQQPAPAPASAAQPASKAQVAEAARSALNDEAQADALKIKKILQENTWLGPNNQSDIMAIAEKWANRPMETPYSRLSSFDYFIAALRRVSFTVGWVVKQFTGVFDQLFHRMSDARVARFKSWMLTRGRTFKNEKAIEMAKFEVSKEDLLEAAELSAEVAAAFATGGGSILLQIGNWLMSTLPGLYQKAKTIIEFVDALRNIKLENLKKFVTAKGLGGLVVGALFGETPNLPVLKQSEGEEQKEPASASEEKGLVKVLHVMMRIFNGLKKAYGKVAEAVNGALAVMNITTKPWFDTFSMVYAAVVKALQAISDPGSVLGEAVGKIRESVSGFFKSIRTKVEGSASDIKAHVELIGKPAQLLRILTDKAVEMVLNIIIHNPPSPLVKLAFKAIETGAKKSILELVREHIPFAETLFKKIAESDTVKRVLQPLEGPIAGVTGAIESVTTKAATLIGETESRILALLGNGADLVKRLIGVSPNPTNSGDGPATAQPSAEAAKPVAQPSAEAAKPAAQPETTGDPPAKQGDFLGIVKQGIHTRLLAIGERNLVQKGKALGRAALETGKAAAQGLATKIRGLLLGAKMRFTAAGKQRELWAEDREGEVVALISGSEIPLKQKILFFNNNIGSIQESDQTEAKQLNGRLKTKNKELKQIAKANPKERDRLEKEIASILSVLEEMYSEIKVVQPSELVSKSAKSASTRTKVYFGGDGQGARKGTRRLSIPVVEQISQPKSRAMKPESALSEAEQSMISSAERAAVRLGKPLAIKTKSATEEGPILRSGFGKRGSGEALTQKVMEIGKEIHHNFAENTSVDEGVPGKAAASHAEKLAAIESPGKALAVDREMCSDCFAFFQKLARKKGIILVVQEPGNLWVFRPDNIRIGLRPGARVILYPDGRASAERISE